MRATNNLSIFYRMYAQMAANNGGRVKWYSRRSVYIIVIVK